MPVSYVTLHPSLVHFPIAFLVLGSMAGLVYLFGPKHEALRTLTWWPLGLGWLGLAPAILSGLLAQQNLPPQAPYSDVLNWHIGTSMALLVIYAAVLYLGWLYRQRRRPAMAADLLDAPHGRRLAPWLLLGLATVIATGYLGGELVYTWGVNTP